MNIIFIGSFYPSERLKEIKDNSRYGIDNAANNFQWALIKGISELHPEIKAVTLPNIRTYPLKYKRMFFNRSEFSFKNNKFECLGFINIVLLKHLVKKNNLYNYLKKNIDFTNDTLIIIYGLHSPFLKAAINIKKRINKIKICQIIPDLPQFMSGSKNKVYRFLKSIDYRLIKKYLKEIDYFVPLTDYMSEMLEFNNKPWIRIEGVYNDCGSNGETIEKEKNKVILYTGNISARYGIQNLLDAFNLIEDEDYRLWIRGEGELKKLVLEVANKDKRIIYFREMPRKDLFVLQKKATVLIVPVPASEEFTKYYFPSKLMDYMASGTPTIVSKLKCIPDEYMNFVYSADREDPEGLKEIIQKVCNKDQYELRKFGEKAAEFIWKNKTPELQVKKIFSMINL